MQCSSKEATDGVATETGIANLVVEMDGELQTPSVHAACEAHFATGCHPEKKSRSAALLREVCGAQGISCNELDAPLA